MAGSDLVFIYHEDHFTIIDLSHLTRILLIQV